MAAIGWGVLEPGTLYTAAELADRYATPVPRVRAALIALTRDGLVATAPGRGYRLTEPTREELRELIELRLQIEVPAVRTAAETGVSERDLAHLRTLARATARLKPVT